MYCKQKMKNEKFQNKAEEFRTATEKETHLLAKKVASCFKGDEVVLLVGDLGSGKTVFAKGIAAGLGLRDIHQVCSPSYTLINIYQAKYPIFHIDLYRLGKEEEILNLGWEDYLGQGVIIVEWAEKIKFNSSAIRVTIEIVEGIRRKIRIEY